VAAPPAQTFNSNPDINNVATQPTATQNPFTSVTSPSGYTGTGSYTPTRPTFGGTVSPTVGPVASSRSPLTNFVTSFSLGTVLGFFNTLLAPPASSPVATQTNVTNQIIVVGSPAQPSSVVVSPPQISVDQFAQPSSANSQAQITPFDYQDLLKLLSEGTPANSPITSIIGASQGAGNTSSNTGSVASQTGTPGSEQALQNLSSPLILDSAITSQIPEATSLALGNVTGQNAVQNIPEQFFVEEASLAQAQSNYQWLQAQIAAWQNAQNAGVCDNTCQDTLSLLQNEVPAQFQQVQQLQALVDAGPQALEATTSTSTASAVPPLTTQAPGAQQQNVAANPASTLQTPVPAEGAPFYTEQNNEWCDQYGQCIPQSSFESNPTPSPDANIGLATTSTILPQNSIAEDPIAAIAQTVQGWVNDILSLFTPSVATTTATTAPCSLFKSFFGGCGGY
jgi:hypothetical protein